MSDPSSAAHGLWMAALDQQANFATDSSLALLRAAMRADSAYFPPYFTYFTELRNLQGRSGRLRTEFGGSNTPLTRCMSRMNRVPSAGGAAVAREMLGEIENDHDPSGCRATFVAAHSANDSPQRRLAEAAAATSAAPELTVVWGWHAAALNALHRQQEAAAVLLEGIGKVPHPMLKLELRLQLAAQRDMMGDSAGARAARVAAAGAVARDGRPHLRWTLLMDRAREARRSGDMATWNRLVREGALLAQAAAAPDMEYRSWMEMGAILVDHSDPKSALEPIGHSVRIASQLRSLERLADSYMKRGRIHASLGLFSESERDLERALAAAAEAGEPHLVAQAHHYLAHTYESQGRWADAVREIDVFTRHARPLRDDNAVYMISLRDAGMIRWRAGWHGAANASFREMVEVIEERRQNYFYAGEFYEQRGEFARAASFYRLGAAGDSGDRPLNLAGLVRMHEALGHSDSALVAARLHDQPGLTFGLPRLLPGVLAAKGRVDEAVRLATLNVAEQEQRGAPRGVASAKLQLARLLLDTRRPNDALREAAEAGRVAGAFQLTGEMVEALHVQGLALLQMGSREAANPLLRARKLVGDYPSASAELAIETALGNALASVARYQEALTAYARAARAGEHVTVGFESAVDRARSRAQQQAPYDGALRTLLHFPGSPARTGQLLEWSARKRNAVINPPRGSGSARPAEFRLSAVQRALAERSALANYITIDNDIFALVVTSRSAQLLHLPMKVAEATELAARIRAPLVATVGGRLDLARARYDLDAAHLLYQGIFKPLEPALSHARRLVVVPDGPLYGIAFNALPRAPPDRVNRVAGTRYTAPAYIIDRYSVAVVLSPTIESVREDKPSPTLGRNVLLVRGRVEGGERESESIVRAWPKDRVASLALSAATEGALREAIAGRSVLHFAVHAWIDERDPLASYLELAPDQADDGLLHATEIAALKFRGDLVVLTSCQTLAGRAFAGTGPFGIATSFLAAGARNVIATHWPVGASAAPLSQELHERLARGESAADALRAAQLRLRRDPATAHPFYWAAYSLIRGGSS